MHANKTLWLSYSLQLAYWFHSFFVIFFVQKKTESFLFIAEESFCEVVFVAWINIIVPCLYFHYSLVKVTENGSIICTLPIIIISMEVVVAMSAAAVLLVTVGGWVLVSDVTRCIMYATFLDAAYSLLTREITVFAVKSNWLLSHVHLCPWPRHCRSQWQRFHSFLTNFLWCFNGSKNSYREFFI